MTHVRTIKKFYTYIFLATSIGGDRPPQKPKALTGESSARNGGHELGSSENGAGWDPNGERELDIRPSWT